MIQRLTLLLILGAASLTARSKASPTPRIRIPEQYSRPLAEATALKEWWKTFNDPLLTQLVERALANNPDLALAQTRLLEARLNTQSAKAGRYPSPSLSLGYTDSQRSNNSPAIPRFDAPPGAAAGPDLIPRRYSLFDLNFDASYEIDWFGANRKSLSATKADQQAQQEDLRDTQVSLSAELARTYFDLREAQARLALTTRQLDSQQQSLHLISLRSRNGLSSQSEEARLRAQIAASQAGIPNLEARIEESVQSIALLSGESASQLRQQLASAGRLPALPSQIPGGLTSDLLKRRPDIRKAYLQLEAATLRRQSAESDWFPKLKLTSSTGGQSGDFANLLSASSIIANFAPKLSWGALNYRQTKTNIQLKEAREAQQAASIEKTVAAAFRDVETALSNFSREGERHLALAEATRAQEDVQQLAQKRYRAGLENLLPSLEAERSVLSAQEAELQSQANQCRHLASLYKALGGGW